MRLDLRVLIFSLVLTFVPRISIAQQVPLAEVVDHAVSQSKLTSPGAAPFHLKATIAERDSPGSPFRGDIELFWVSPEKWRRVIHSPDFSQTLIVNGDQVQEEDTGDYFPYWLNEFVRAITDPLPMSETLKKTATQISQPGSSRQSNSCARFQSKIGAPPAQNDAFSLFCFEGSHGLLDSVLTPGYSVQFKNYKNFGEKHVAHLLVTDPEPGTTIEATITGLTDLKDPDESLFAIAQPTSKDQQLQMARVPDADLPKLYLQTPEIVWPAIRTGHTSGVLSMLISADRSGHVREAYPLNSDNSDLNDTARDQVRKWQFKPAVSEGVPVQVESVLTLAFTTKTENPFSILTNDEVRKLATSTPEPNFSPGVAPSGTKVTIRILVDPGGKVLTVQNLNKLPSQLLLPAYNAATHWRFQPYLRDGKPDSFYADITFSVP